MSNRNDQPSSWDAACHSRRRFLKSSSAALGSACLADRADAAIEVAESASPAAERDRLMHKVVGGARAKQVIFLHMVGGPSQLELFDWKTELQQRHGERCPAGFRSGSEYRSGGVLGQERPNRLLGPQASFRRHGQSGAWISDHLPAFSRWADSVAFIKSMVADSHEHGAAQRTLHTGCSAAGAASLGARITHLLGTSTTSGGLPAHVALTSALSHVDVEAASWGAGSLPSDCQGIRLRCQGDAVLCVTDSAAGDAPLGSPVVPTVSAIRRRMYEALGEPEAVIPIARREWAFRMQPAAAEAMDLRSESDEVLRLYGAQPGGASFANNCLRARRLVERGVRFVQVFDGGWDSHGTTTADALNVGFRDKCRQLDRSVSGLLHDLQRRGLLDETLIVWSGEFGRTPVGTIRGVRNETLHGRGDQPGAFTAWLAGAGVNAGITVGATDPLGATVIDQPVTAGDLHAAMASMMGLDPSLLSSVPRGEAGLPAGIGTS